MHDRRSQQCCFESLPDDLAIVCLAQLDPSFRCSWADHLAAGWGSSSCPLPAAAAAPAAAMAATAATASIQNQPLFLCRLAPLLSVVQDD